MNRRMLRMLLLAILLLSLGEVLLLQWASLALRGFGLAVAPAVTALCALVAFNYFALRWARGQLHSVGLPLFLSRLWLLTSVAVLMSGLLLAIAFVLVGGSFPLAGLAASAPNAIAWTGSACVALGFGSVLWGASVGDYRVRTDRVELPARRFAKRHHDLRIAHITDLHIGPLLRPDRLARFVARINRLEPDVATLEDPAS